jgi:hypothetical protein
MKRMRTTLAAVLVAGLVLGATACGGGGSSDETSTGDALKSSAESTTTTEKSSGTQSTSDMGTGLDSRGNAGDCLEAAGAYATIGLSILTYMGGATPAQLAELQAQVDEIKGQIPASIQDDFQVFADGIAEYASAMQGVDMSNILDPSVQDELTKASEALDSPEMTEAQANIEAYFDANCS